MPHINWLISVVNKHVQWKPLNSGHRDQLIWSHFPAMQSHQFVLIKGTVKLDCGIIGITEFTLCKEVKNIVSFQRSYTY